MSSTPIFDQVIAGITFTAPPKLEYTDRYTPEVARNEGSLYGAENMKQEILKLARAVPRPTKQLQELIQAIEDITHE